MSCADARQQWVKWHKWNSKYHHFNSIGLNNFIVFCLYKLQRIMTMRNFEATTEPAESYNKCYKWLQFQIYFFDLNCKNKLFFIVPLSNKQKLNFGSGSGMIPNRQKAIATWINGDIDLKSKVCQSLTTSTLTRGVDTKPISSIPPFSQNYQNTIYQLNTMFMFIFDR